MSCYERTKKGKILPIQKITGTTLGEMKNLHVLSI